MRAVEIKPGIHWVGAIDWAVRDFHGYVTPRGSTYNNYLIVDEQITLLDAVKLDFVDVSLDNIASVTDPRNIRHIVVNHIEPDHCGGLGRIMEVVPKAKLHCTEKARLGMDRMFDTSAWDITVVKTGDELRIGRRTLMFLETPMLHWPDSMMTYVREDRLLISQDAFGQHLASAHRFDDEFVSCSSMSELDDAVWDYYANILMPFGTLIERKIREVRELGLEIDMIAPDHGVIWRSGVDKVLQMYLDMARGAADERVVVIYDTMWHGTEKMMQPIVEGVRDEDMDCRVFKLRSTPMSVATKEFWRARGTLIGSPTLNNTLFPSVGEFLYNLRGLRPKNRIMSAFGSYGWSGGGVKEVIESIRAMKLKVVEPGVQVMYRASGDEEQMCYEFGRSFARATREYHGEFKAAVQG